MYSDLLTTSPEEKLKNYLEINNSDASGGYINYTPNVLTPISQELNQIIKPVNITSTLQPSVPKPTLFRMPIQGEQSKVVEPVTPAADYKIEKPVPLYVKPSSGSAKDAYRYLIDKKGLAPHVAAGIVGNLEHESGLKTGAKGDGGTSFGIAQWHNERWKGFQDWSAKRGKDPMDLYNQLDYVLTEPGQESAIKATLAAKDVDEAAMTFGKKFERPAEATADWNRRRGIALHLFNNK